MLTRGVEEEFEPIGVHPGASVCDCGDDEDEEERKDNSQDKDQDLGDDVAMELHSAKIAVRCRSW